MGIEALVARHRSGLERLETRKEGESFVDSLLWEIIRKRDAEIRGRDIVRRGSVMDTISLILRKYLSIELI